MERARKVNSIMRVARGKDIRKYILPFWLTYFVDAQGLHVIEVQHDTPNYLVFKCVNSAADTQTTETPEEVIQHYLRFGVDAEAARIYKERSTLHHED